ncbi:MAG TPA: hypothetical protein PK675_02955 [Clostridia bacterium]|nr:hypothetical protein [Clostridia bacterium]
MRKNPYDILQINSDATKEEIEEAYIRLRDIYREQRYERGARGEEAAELLQEVEFAYSEAMREVNSRHTSSEGSELYERIKALIKTGNYDAAQNLLDDCSVRDAEWHYIQSTVYFQKSWYIEAKKQLEYAIQLEPNNIKYTNALDRLNKYLASNTISPDQLRTTTRPVDDNDFYPNNGTCTGSCCGDVCLANLCANCLCGGCR